MDVAEVTIPVGQEGIRDKAHQHRCQYAHAHQPQLCARERRQRTCRAQRDKEGERVKKRMCSRYRGKSGPYALTCCPAWIVSAWSIHPVNTDTRKSSRVSLPIHACRGKGCFASASTKAYAAGAASAAAAKLARPSHSRACSFALRGVHKERTHPQQQGEGEQSEAGVEAGEGIAGVRRTLRRRRGRRGTADTTRRQAGTWGEKEEKKR